MLLSKLNEVQQNYWQIWIDTGGTFTDCIARTYTGETYRIKVLSNSTLRGSCLSKISENAIRFTANWPSKKNIFSGYQFYFLNNPQQRLTITAVDFEEEIMYFREKNIESKGDFAITANEEAPVLAARLVTETPLNAYLPHIDMRLGSTRGTNALLERKGARCALLITSGFKDLLSIGTQQRPDIFNLKIEKPTVLYESVFEIDERIDAAGNVLKSPSPQPIAELLQKISRSGINSLAIATLHSYRFPKHEVLIAEMAQEAGIEFISSSYQVAPAIKILPRATTTLVNAYLAPVIETYLSRIKSKIRQGSLKIMSSAGGLFESNFYTPKDSLLSGPAGGVIGAVAVARSAGYQRIISFDMGGTSTDVSRYDHGFDYDFETKVGDATLMSPCLAIETVAAGGGSICHYDGHKITVGPDSAGAWPGPACYGAGGTLTITDVNLLLGRIDETRFAFPLNKEAATRAFHELYPEAGNQEEILDGFLQIANEKMAGAVRKISINKGFQAEDHVLLSFGGAGGQHACAVADLLNIKTIIFPQDASLLSAYGMGIAREERIAQTQILQPLDAINNKIEDLLEKTKIQAIEALHKEGIATDEIEVMRICWFMRFKGQDHTIEVTGKENLEQCFKEEYQKIYGHWIEDRQIEVESLKVIAAAKTGEIGNIALPEKNYPPQSQKFIKTYFGKWQNTPLFELEMLLPGAVITGPALISSHFSMFVINPGWQFSFIHEKVAIAEKVTIGIKDQKSRDDIINLELFTNRFRSVANDMGALLQRTAFSVNIKERKDFSTAILNKEGLLVVNAPHIPVHLGSLGVCVRSVLENIKIAPGDVVITNHPGHGGSHLPDITLISGIFDSGEELIGYVANRAHHAEMGGKTPGSMPPDGKNLLEEGVIISPTYLVKAGVPQWHHIEHLLKQGPYPSRNVAENLADLNAGLASLQYGKQVMAQMSENTTLADVRHYMQMILDYSSAMMKQVWKKYAGIYEAEELLDDNSKLKVKVSIAENNVIFDFSGTSPVHSGNFNATPAIVNSVVIYVLRLILNQFTRHQAITIPLNEGILQDVKIHLPECLLNPPLDLPSQKCPAVVGGNTETSQRLTDTLLKAFGLAACSQGTMNNLLFGNQSFGYYETIGGGSGAGDGFAGSDAVHQHMTNTAITDPEIMELRYPVLVNSFSIRPDSGGSGKWPGGNGITRQLTFLQPVQFSLLSQHRKHAPYGLSGGNPGKPGNQWLIRKNGEIKTLNGIDGGLLQAGDQLTIETPGGGGYGPKNPLR